MSEEIDSDGHIRIKCDVPKCHYSVRYGHGYEDHDRARETFEITHRAQHDNGKTPDLRYMSVTISGTCSNCGSRFENEDYEAGDRIWCTHCSASWDEWGYDGRTDVIYSDVQ